MLHHSLRQPAMTDLVSLMSSHGIRPTANRILVAKTLALSFRPLSLMELESLLDTLDKSSIYRALSVFREHHLVHVFEDGDDMVLYELCGSHDAERDDDLHVHFYCELCHKTFCLQDTPLPQVSLPDGYRMSSVNYMVKGICPSCDARRSGDGRRTEG